MTTWPPYATDERAAWSRRAVRFLNDHGRWCDLCEARTVTLGPFTLPVKLEVHHSNGRGVYNLVGQEWDSELMVLCCRCHERITTIHRRLARQRRIQTKDGYGHDTPAYAAIIAEVTKATRPLYLRRAVRRVLFGLPIATQDPRAHDAP